MTMNVRPIGEIRTEFSTPQGTPIQAAYADAHEAEVEVWEPYAAGLADLAGFERVWLIYWFHQAPEARMRVTPFRDTRERGLFATRAPCRPNPIGMSSVRLLSVEGRFLRVAGADMLDGTPLLDLKPYAPMFDAFQVERCGWLDAKRTDRTTADGRFLADDEQVAEE
ncbi:MAG: tRNA (N6-threonylcarbamoyladenosine(37)-N6)-methyltransferase TrmO [bacterium]|nr:tRNA (N6-threonylcarbamoyladenosine(37)-N6)-methyltransferase TrmO [bacterium]